jgi:hypothetical protein
MLTFLFFSVQFTKLRSLDLSGNDIIHYFPVFTTMVKAGLDIRYRTVPVQDSAGTGQYRYRTVPVQDSTGTRQCRYRTVPVQDSAGTGQYRYKRVPVQDSTGTGQCR